MKQEKLNFWHIPAGMLVAVAVLALLMCSCKSIEYVPVIEKEVHHDSIYFTKVQRDSVWLHDSIAVKEKGDTVLIEKWHTKYIKHEVHDTVYLATHDTIPQPYPYAIYKDRELTTVQVALMTIGGLAIMVLLVFIVDKLKRFLPCR